MLRNKLLIILLISTDLLVGCSANKSVVGEPQQSTILMGPESMPIETGYKLSTEEYDTYQVLLHEQEFKNSPNSKSVMEICKSLFKQ